VKALPIYLTLEEPLLAPALNGDPNSAVSYPFIPGSLIRGALIAEYTHSRPPADLPGEAGDRFFNGKTRFLNAYPVGPGQMRALPLPLSWQREKLEHPLASIYDLSGGARPGQGRKLSQPFYARQNGQIILLDPARQFNVHTRREDRVMGRATVDSGAVFRYEALAPGQTFAGAILFDNNQAAEDLLGDGRLFLGGSRSTAYGQVTVTAGQPQTDWREIGGQAGQVTSIPAGSTFRLTLLSDLIFQDERGQYSTRLVESDLARWFEPVSAKIEVAIEQLFKAEGMVGGFNRKWGLPLIQLPVIQAGSVFVLRAKSEIPAQAIQRLEAQGVGQRRVDGFGRVAITRSGSPTEAVLTVYQAAIPETAPAETAPEPVSLPDQASQKLAETMYQRLMRAKIEDRLTVFVNQQVKLAPNGISRSQLARLRVEVRGHLAGATEQSAQAVLEWLGKFRSTGRKQYEQARVEHESLLSWLEQRLKSPQAIWQILGIEPAKMPLAQIKTVEINQIASGAFAAETTLRLIDGVLAKLAREAGKK
jgi:CRISPR-associated protein Csx10